MSKKTMAATRGNKISKFPYFGLDCICLTTTSVLQDVPSLISYMLNFCNTETFIWINFYIIPQHLNIGVLEFLFHNENKANLRDLVAATGIVILLKLD